MTKTPDSDALVVLRALFDLAEVDVRPSLALVGGLLALDELEIEACVTQLRRHGLVARERLAPTMVGLAIATALPPIEPRPMGPRLVLVEQAA